MRCTNPYKLEQDILKVTLTELRRAVTAHGGRVTLRVDAEDQRPVIIANTDEGPTNTVITEVHIREDGTLAVTGYDASDVTEETVEHDVEDFLAVELGYITEAILPTADTNDVTLSAMGDLGVDPEILCNLVTGTWPAFSEAGMPYSRYYQTVLERARKLTREHALTDWKEKDFWLTMDEEADRLVAEVLNPMLRNAVRQSYAGKGPAAIKAMDVILSHPGNNLNRLAIISGMTISTMTKAVAGLMAKGFIKPTPIHTFEACFETLDGSWKD